MPRIRKIIRFAARRAKLKNIIVSLLALLLCIIIIEAACFLTLLIKEKLNPEEGIYTEKSNRYIINDEEVGYKGIPNTTSHEIKYYDRDRIIFNALYELDEYGRRKTKEKPNRPHLILLGGSFTFGYGLNNNETLSYFLSELTDYGVYNYGVGAGPHQMLAQIEREEFREEVPSERGIAIYIFIDHHIRRAIGDMEVLNQEVPYYYLDKENKLQRRETFKIGRPIISRIYRVLQKSNFFKLFNIKLPPKSEEHIYLTARIIEEGKKTYESKFNGTFYFLAHPESRDSEETKKLIFMLKEAGIQIIDAKVPFFENKHTIKGDNHPNGKLNRALAEAIANDLNTKTR